MFLLCLPPPVVDLRDVRPAIQDLTHPELSLSWLP